MHEQEIHELEAALMRWRSLILLGDLQRRAYLEQGEEPADADEPYRSLAFRFAEEIMRLRARVAELESREDQEA